MLDGIDAIQWKDLTHAYGSAADVPGLLRALRTSPPDAQHDESPLWKLFTNIWHQGTVYEATAYAVPFLIELSADRATPDRTGILHLLSEIARGSSYRNVHGNRCNDPEFAEKKARELEWVTAAHEAVAAGFPKFVSMTKESGDIGLAAAHVLSRLPAHAEPVAKLVREMFRTESVPLSRAGLLLLLGFTGSKSETTMSALLEAIELGDLTQRRAATLSIAVLRPQPMPPIARKAILEALTADDLGQRFEGLPWDADPDSEVLRQCLDAAGRNEAAESLIAKIESRKAQHNDVSTLLNILFPMEGRIVNSPIKPQDLSSLQMRAVRAMEQAMQGGKRIFVGYFPQWGLPDTRRGWRDLAAGRESAPIDLTLPLLTDATDPARPLRPDTCIEGQRVRHRTFGLGTVRQTKPSGGDTILKMEFDEEGPKMLQLPSDGSPPRAARPTR